MAAEPAPLVSVIIPTWNRAPMLRLTLQTVLGQDLADFEALVIGDGCTDGSEAVVASFGDPRLRWHNLPVNSGSASAPNNTGLGMARGSYIAHLGHDDFWLPWHLSGLVQTIEENGADWVYPLVVAIGPDGIRHCTGPPRPDVPHAEHHVPPSGWLYRREVAAAVGWWADPARIPWQIDFDYLRRAALAGTRFAFLPRPTTLKFPSNHFPDGYRTGEPAPIQREYLERIRREPEALERELLQTLAIRFAQIDRGSGKGLFARSTPKWAATPSFVWGLRRWLVSRYGAERWPVPQLMRWRFQRRRLGRLYLRGLPTAAADPDAAPGAADGPPGQRAARHARPRRTDPVARMRTRDARRERRRERAARNAGRAAPDAVLPDSDARLPSGG